MSRNWHAEYLELLKEACEEKGPSMAYSRGC